MKTHTTPALLMVAALTIALCTTGEVSTRTAKPLACGCGCGCTMSAVATNSSALVVRYGGRLAAGALAATNYTVSGDGRGSLAPNPAAVTLLTTNSCLLTWRTGRMSYAQLIRVCASNATCCMSKPCGPKTTQAWTPCLVVSSASGPGIVLPSGDKEVMYGCPLSFSNLPQVGCHIATVTVDNVARGAPETYSFNAVTSCHSVAVQFAAGSVPSASDVAVFSIRRSTEHGQVVLSWSNNTVTVLACTDRWYSTKAASWTAVATGVPSPWTHTASEHLRATYYRIASGTHTSAYDVGRFDIDVAPDSIAWISFPFAIQEGYRLSDWFGTALTPSAYSSFSFPILYKQHPLGGRVSASDYYIDDMGTKATNWFPNDLVAGNSGYILVLPGNHAGVRLTCVGVVPTNTVSLQLPCQAVPWVGLPYPAALCMDISGMAPIFVPPARYSTFNYDYVMSQERLGGSSWYAEYFINDWGSGTTGFFPSVTGSDVLEPGKAYLIFFSTSRMGTNVWTVTQPY